MALQTCFMSNIFESRSCRCTQIFCCCHHRSLSFFPCSASPFSIAVDCFLPPLASSILSGKVISILSFRIQSNNDCLPFICSLLMFRNNLDFVNSTLLNVVVHPRPHHSQSFFQSLLNAFVLLFLLMQTGCCLTCLFFLPTQHVSVCELAVISILSFVCQIFF